jgi:cystathionine gamma-lyase
VKETSQLHIATRVIHGGQESDPSTGAVMPPIYATSTFEQESPGVHKGLDYGRSHNPTRWALERCVADLEGGSAAFAFASGLAAISAVLELLPAGSHIVAGDDMYGGTYRLFERVRRRSAGHDFSYVNLADPDALKAALRPETAMVWVESPTNPMLKLADLQAIGALCSERRIMSVCDNTFASPIVQRPLELGIDIVVHSTTKFMNGHSDVIGGVAVVGAEPQQEGWRDQLRYRGRSTASSCYAGSRRWRCGWSAAAPTRWSWRAGWSASRKSGACTTRDWNRIRSMRWRGGR